MAEAAERICLGPLQNPVRGLLDASGALFSLAAASWLAALEPGDPALRRILLVFALSHAGLFTASFLYHALPWERGWKRRMQRLDHSMIYLKIAASVTPLVWAALDGPWRDGLLVAAWGIAGFGVAQKVLLPEVNERLSIPFQVLQACLVLPALGPFADRFEPEALALFTAAALFYSAGAVVFVTERPRLWPRLFSFHDLFHVLVIAGNLCLFQLLVHTLPAL